MEIEEPLSDDDQPQSGGTLLLSSLAPEILHRITLWLGRISFPDLTHLASTSTSWKHRIYDDPDPTLWRELHHDLYDDPCSGGHKAAPQANREVAWREEVIARWRVERVLERRRAMIVGRDGEGLEKQGEIELVGRTLLQMYAQIPAPPTERSKNAKELEKLLLSPGFDRLYHSSMIPASSPYLLRNSPARVRKTYSHPDERLAHLHVLVGWYNEVTELHRARTLAARLTYLTSLGIHRRITYSIRSFSPLTDFGPFHPDGTVRWSVVDSIAQVMDANITYAAGRSVYKGVPSRGGGEWGGVKGRSCEGLQGARGVRVEEGMEGDWAGVTGVHKGTYAFMDYTDWIQNNYSNLDIIPQQQVPVDMDSYLEAYGSLMTMTLTTSPSTTPLPAPYPTHLPTHPSFPPLPFHGTSFHSSAAEGTSVRGAVYVTPDREVRWSWVVRYGGGDRWRLEGVMVGGRGSRRGVVGVWSDAERGGMSPVGPFAYWPVDEEEEEEEEDEAAYVSRDEQRMAQIEDAIDSNAELRGMFEGSDEGSSGEDGEEEGDEEVDEDEDMEEEKGGKGKGKGKERERREDTVD